MRRFLVVAALLLGGCATRPDDIAMYKGVYAPRSTQIASDGSFTSRSSVWKVADRVIATQAARNHLRQEAVKAGYSFVEIREIRKETLFGQQVMIVGKLYKSSNGSNRAVPVSSIEFTGDPANGNDLAPAPKAKAKAAKAVRAAQPVAKPQPKPKLEKSVPADEPLVIEAPDFISVLPQKRPLG